MEPISLDPSTDDNIDHQDNHDSHGDSGTPRPTLSHDELKQMLEYIVKNIVSEKDKVDISIQDDVVGSCTVNIQVSEVDKGRVIGKRGRTIKAIRDLVGIFGRIIVVIKE